MFEIGFATALELTTRAVAGINSSVTVNRALWMLAGKMRRPKV